MLIAVLCKRFSRRIVQALVGSKSLQVIIWKLNRRLSWETLVSSFFACLKVTTDKVNYGMERALPFFPSISRSLSFWSGQRLCWLLWALRPDFLLWKCVFPHSIQQSSGENKNTSHVVFASTGPTISQLQTTVQDLHRAEREIAMVDGFQEEHSHYKCPLSQERHWFVSAVHGSILSCLV